MPVFAESGRKVISISIALLSFAVPWRSCCRAHPPANGWSHAGDNTQPAASCVHDGALYHMRPSPCAALPSPCRPIGTARLRGTTRTRNATRGTRQTANGARDRARRGAARSALRTLTLSISASSAEYLVRSDARSRGFFLPSAPSTSAPGLGSPPAHICTGTGLNPAHICTTTRAHACPQSAQGLRSPSASPSEPPLMSSTTCSSSVSPPSSASDEAM